MSSSENISTAISDVSEVLSPNAIKIARFSALGAVLLLCFLALLSLAIEVFNKLEHLKEANTDNAEWSFSQIEVDYYRMRSEFEIANYTKLSDLSAASKSFDVFYSPIVNVSSGPYASFLLADMETARSLNDSWTPRRISLMRATPPCGADFNLL